MRINLILRDSKIISCPTSFRVLIYLIVLVSLLAASAGCDSIPSFPPKNLGSVTPTEAAQASPVSPKPATVVTPSSTPVPVATIAVGQEELRGQILRFWHPWSGPAGQAIASMVEEFNLHNPWGILVTAAAYPGYDRLAAELASSRQTANAPQVVAGLLHQALVWDQSEQLVDLQPYVTDPNYGLNKEEQANFYPQLWDQDLVDGRRLGFPAYFSGQLIFYNQTWARELGFQLPPATPEQFRQQACAAAQANMRDADPENNGTGGLIVSTDPGTLLSWIEAFGGKALKSPAPGPGQNVYQFNTPEIEDAFTFLREMYDDGCAWQSQNQTPDEPFARRLGLFAAGSVLDLPYQNQAFKVIGSQDQWTVLPFPSPSLEPAIDVFGPSYFIMPASPQQQLAAWLFIRWLSSAENNARLAGSIGAIPVRSEARTALAQYAAQNPQWAAAVDLVKYARSEPAYASWGKVRRALGDVATQLYRSYFTVDQIPGTLKYLDNFAAELHLGPDLESLFATPTSTLKPGVRPKPTPAASASPSS